MSCWPYRGRLLCKCYRFRATAKSDWAGGANAMKSFDSWIRFAVLEGLILAFCAAVFAQEKEIDPAADNQPGPRQQMILFFEY